MKALRLALVALACSAPLLAAAQWQWLDSSGRKVFSDRPPPPDVPPARIQRQPGVRAPATEATPVPAAAAAPAVAAPQLAGKDKGLEDKRKEAEAAAAAKKRAEEEQVAAVRADNCRRARTGKADLDSGMRMARTNDKGEREVLDDKQREQEMKYLNEVIARDCTALAPTSSGPAVGVLGRQ